jgi:hypothetical protein
MVRLEGSWATSETREAWAQVLDCLDEVRLLYSDREIDGVEVGFAVEAATEIGAGIDGGMILVAARTEERQLSLAHFVRPLEVLQKSGPRDLVAEAM